MKASLWFTVALGLVACGGGGKDPRIELAKENRPRVQARMDKLVAAAKAGKAAKDNLGAPGDSKVILDNVSGSSGGKDNAFAALAGDLEDSKAPGPSEDESNDTAPIFMLSVSNTPVVGKVVLRYSEEKPTGYFTEGDIKDLLGAQYVLIVYPERFTPPRVAIGSGFEPGTFDGYAVAVEIETAKPIGGFTVHAESSEQIEIKRNTSTGSTDAESKIRRDIRSNLGKAVEKGAEARWPGSKLVFAYY